MHFGEIFAIAYVTFIYLVIGIVMISCSKLKISIYTLPLLPSFITIGLFRLLLKFLKLDKVQTIHKFCKTPISDLIKYKIKLEKK